MIQEAVVQLSILRQDGAVLIVCKKDVKLPDLFAIKGGLDLTSKGEELDSQNFAVDGQDFSLSSAELPQEKNSGKAEMTDAATQSDKTSEVDAVPAKPDMIDQESQVDLNVRTGDKVCVDVEIQTQNISKTEDVEMQTEELAKSSETDSEKVDTLTKQITSDEQNSVDVRKSIVVQSVEVQTDSVKLKNETVTDSEMAEELPKPATEDISTQTDIEEGPVLNDLLARIADLQTQRTDMIKAEPSTSDSTPHRKGLRKRLFTKQLSSTEVSDNENYDVNDEDDEDGSGDDYESDKSFVKVTKQWNKDLQSVISSLQQDENGPDKQDKQDKMITRASKPNVKTNAGATQNSSKRKRGRPRKVPQEIKHESSGDEDDSPIKDSEDMMDETKKKKVFRCPGCDEIFMKKVLLKKHRLECTAPVMDKTPHEKSAFYECPTCNKTYTKMSHMKRHQKSHEDVKEHICQFCSKGFVRKEHKEKHELTHQVLKCQYCEEVVTGKANLIRHEKAHFPSEPTPKKQVKKTTPCRYCGKLFSGKAQCEQHEITHTNERPFKCSYCDMSFSKRGNTLKHERRIHLHLKPYLCQYCGKAFAQKPDCKKHEMRHLGEKRVKCNYCDKMFLENHHRIVHERTHTGERPYKCVICNHAFAQSYDCKKHMRIHLKDKGVKQGVASSEMEEAKAVEYLQLQVHRQAKAAEESNSIQHQQIAAQQQQQEQQQQQQAPQQQHIMEGAQMYPIYDYQAISTNALNPEYMMQAVASSTLHQIAPQAPAAVFAPHHELQAAAPFMQNTFDIRKMQEIMNSQNNADNTKLMP